MALGRNFLTALTRATGTLTADADGDIVNAMTLVIAGHTYIFMADSTGLVNKYCVRWIQDDYDTSMQNLKKAINLDGTAGTDYHEDMEKNTHVTATEAAGVVTITAIVAGSIGNFISFSEDADIVLSGSGLLTGGAGFLSTAINELQAQCQLDSEVIAALAYMESGSN